MPPGTKDSAMSNTRYEMGQPPIELASQAMRDYQRQRQMTLGDLLLEKLNPVGINAFFRLCSNQIITAPVIKIVGAILKQLEGIIFF